jgi:hypothetical protein
MKILLTIIQIGYAFILMFLGWRSYETLLLILNKSHWYSDDIGMFLIPMFFVMAAIQNFYLCRINKLKIKKFKDD